MQLPSCMTDGGSALSEPTWSAFPPQIGGIDGGSKPDFNTSPMPMTWRWTDLPSPTSSSACRFIADAKTPIQRPQTPHLDRYFTRLKNRSVMLALWGAVSLGRPEKGSGPGRGPAKRGDKLSLDRPHRHALSG